MTRDRFAHPLHPLRGASLAKSQGAARPSACEPLDENALAQEIARIMERCSSAPHHTCHATPARWLGDEADRALVESYQMTPASTAYAGRPGEPDAYDDLDTIAAAEGDDTPPANFGAGTAAQWVRQARRDRFRTRVRDAAGWTISVMVSLLLVAVVGLAMYGWPDGTATVRQLQAKLPKVSTNLRLQHPTPVHAPDRGTRQSQFATADVEASR